MNTLKSVAGQWTYYVQPADKASNEFVRNCLPEVNPVSRVAEEGVGVPKTSPYNLYLVDGWGMVERLMSITKLYFNLFVRDPSEALPHFKMRKSEEIEKRNRQAEKPNGEKFSLVRSEKPLPTKKEEAKPSAPAPKRSFPKRPELAKKNERRLKNVLRPKQKILFLVPEKKRAPKPVPARAEVGLKTAPQSIFSEKYVIVALDRESTHTMTHVWKALQESGLSTDSVRESGKSCEEYYDFVWEANGDAIFRLWRYARQNPLVHCAVLRTTKDGVFENFEPVFCYSSEKIENQASKVVPYRAQQK
ncbi:MAG: hypothetical protein WCT49_02730 [Candidatus Paceibacterota bacterium]|jgi:hypothetical protein|nr:hypothetical protein [Candidatus Paceibacterota bacterium]